MSPRQSSLSRVPFVSALYGGLLCSILHLTFPLHNERCLCLNSLAPCCILSSLADDIFTRLLGTSGTHFFVQSGGAALGKLALTLLDHALFPLNGVPKCWVSWSTMHCSSHFILTSGGLCELSYARAIPSRSPYLSIGWLFLFRPHLPYFSHPRKTRLSARPCGLSGYSRCAVCIASLPLHRIIPLHHVAVYRPCCSRGTSLRYRRTLSRWPSALLGVFIAALLPARLTPPTLPNAVRPSRL
jgi:hypothetical protein